MRADAFTEHDASSERPVSESPSPTLTAASPVERSGRSPITNTTFKDSLTGLVHRIRATISPTREIRPQDQRGRSTERKNVHENPISTGRGGIGNMVSSSSKDRYNKNFINDHDHPSSRDHLSDQKFKSSDDNDELIRINYQRNHSNLRRSHGRGGAGNIRCPSRDPHETERIKNLEAEERQVETEYADRVRNDPISIGRGGVGNIIHS